MLHGRSRTTVPKSLAMPAVRAIAEALRTRSGAVLRGAATETGVAVAARAGRCHNHSASRLDYDMLCWRSKLNRSDVTLRGATQSEEHDEQSHLVGRSNRHHSLHTGILWVQQVAAAEFHSGAVGCAVLAIVGLEHRIAGGGRFRILCSCG